MLPGFDGTNLWPVFRSSTCIHVSHSVTYEGDIVCELLFVLLIYYFMRFFLLSCWKSTLQAEECVVWEKCKQNLAFRCFLLHPTGLP